VDIEQARPSGLAGTDVPSAEDETKEHSASEAVTLKTAAYGRDIIVSSGSARSLSLRALVTLD
jgi:hypothetical protein